MEEKLLNIAKEIFDTEELTLDTKKEEIAEWDSAANLILLSEIEEELEIEVSIEKIEEISCLRDFLNL